MSQVEISTTKSVNKIARVVYGMYRVPYILIPLALLLMERSIHERMVI